MSKKVLYVDVETTGLDQNKNEIVQLAGIIEIDGEVKEKFDIFMKPNNFENIEQEALDVQHKTMDQVLSYPERSKGFVDFLEILDRHINKFDKSDKFLAAGQNVYFDFGFVRQMFWNNGSQFFKSYFHDEKIDSIKMYKDLMTEGKVDKLAHLNLDKICSSLGVELTNAHDGASDIQATYEIIKIMQKVK